MQNSEALFRDKPVWQAIFSLVGPSILSVLVMVVYNMTDLFFIGLLRDTAQTAAVSIVSPVFTLVSAGATVLGMGGCAVAAAATVLGNLVACAFYLVYMLRHSRALSLAPADALRDPARLGRVLALGLPNGVSSLLAGCAGSFSNRLLAGYGTAALAAMAAADKATMVVSLVQMGICMGVQPLLAYNVGARDLGRLRAVIRRLLALTIGFGAAFAAACLMGQEALLRLFLSDAEALALGRSLLACCPGCCWAARCWACTTWASTFCRRPAGRPRPRCCPRCGRARCCCRRCTYCTRCWACPAWPPPAPPPMCWAPASPLSCSPRPGGGSPGGEGGALPEV